jgi:hypothetical protein
VKYSGKLACHTEMGCGSWPQFHDDRGLHGDNNQYWNWDWTINFGKKTKIDKLTLYDKDNNVVYDGTWTFDRVKTLNNRCFSSPKEIEPIEWSEMVSDDLRAEVETDEIVEALKDKDE